MSRFAIFTILAAPVFFSIGMFFHGWAFWGVYLLFWIVYLAVLALGATQIQWQFYCSSVCRGDTESKIVALTFDDGPDPAVTPMLLDLLQQEKIPAAFFCIGKNVQANPQVVRRISSEGHLIGNHTFSHGNNVPLMLRARLCQEIESTQVAIHDAVGERPKWFRPPFGVTTPHFKAAMKRCGLGMAGWDVRSFDTRNDSDVVIQRVVSQARPGSIILLHDAGIPAEKVLTIARLVIQQLREKGFEFVRLDQLIGSPQNPLPQSATVPHDASSKPSQYPNPAGDRHD
jgi:peptidoglycan/xylan/chitin deacetylase (PgdA/CDA1 family)